MMHWHRAIQKNGRNEYARFPNMLFSNWEKDYLLDSRYLAYWA